MFRVGLRFGAGGLGLSELMYLLHAPGPGVLLL